MQCVRELASCGVDLTGLGQLVSLQAREQPGLGQLIGQQVELGEGGTKA